MCRFLECLRRQRAVRDEDAAVPVQRPQHIPRLGYAAVRQLLRLRYCPVLVFHGLLRIVQKPFHVPVPLVAGMIVAVILVRLLFPLEGQRRQTEALRLRHNGVLDLPELFPLRQLLLFVRYVGIVALHLAL